MLVQVEQEERMSPTLGRRPTPGSKARQGVLTSSGKILLCAMGLPMGMFLLQACTIITASEPVYIPPLGETVRIPSGHLPPPGKCRIWFPDRPPGHQPPPGDCHALQFQVPLGATLIYGK